MDLEKLGNTCVTGLQWGDEGKGKIVDLLTDHFDLAVRYSGGSNAGHTVNVSGQRFALHLLPSAILHPEVTSVVAVGVAFDPKVAVEEIEGLRRRGVVVGDNLRISDRAHVVMPYHRRQDELSEAKASGKRRIGTTARGIGPCYADKMIRTLAIRVCDLIDPRRFRDRLGPIVAEKNRLFAALYETDDSFDTEQIVESYGKYAEKLRPFICDTTALVHQAVADGKRILFEGAQGALLDIDHGTFPYVTSSNSSGCAVGVGAGVSASVLKTCIGVVKAYFTRVGEGPFPSELNGAVGDYIREHGQEYGTTTGRPRRCGWFDAVAASYSIRLGGVTDVALMHLDTLAGLEEVGICVAYQYKDQRLKGFNADEEVLAEVKPVYEMMPGWGEDISAASRMEDLPKVAVNYIDRLEQLLATHISIVSIGPERTQTILR